MGVPKKGACGRAGGPQCSDGAGNTQVERREGEESDKTNTCAVVWWCGAATHGHHPCGGAAAIKVTICWLGLRLPRWHGPRGAWQGSCGPGGAGPARQLGWGVGRAPAGVARLGGGARLLLPLPAPLSRCRTGWQPRPPRSARCCPGCGMQPPPPHRGWRRRARRRRTTPRPPPPVARAPPPAPPARSARRRHGGR